ncbi:MAG: UbiX family flavin prenyltransferase [Candidatus Dormibacteria bacterium]
MVGVSGGSGAVLARLCLEDLLGRGERVYLVATPTAKLVWQDELGVQWQDEVERLARLGPLIEYSHRDYNTPIATGSLPTRGMVVVPCSMGSAAAIAHGLATDLLKRAADVHIKEARRLVVVPREVPLSAIHLDNLARLAHLGVRVVPPMPAYYRRPASLDEVNRQVADRVLEALLG